MKLRDTPGDLFTLIGETSDARGLPASQVEKDYWVVELLRSVAKPIEHGRVIFKGGTSQSKAFGIIERFSEDVDLLVVADEGLGKGRVDAILKAIVGAPPKTSASPARCGRRPRGSSGTSVTRIRSRSQGWM